jgi:creatinine amidohydrolase/Fe(II)-dependent formamide hydrolase-like protein
MLHAALLAREAVNVTGGVVLPPLPLGTETYLSVERVRDRGFSGTERIVGMDFPGLALSSLYVEDSAFGVIVHEVIRALKRQAFQVIAIINGHGGRNHLVTLDRIAVEETEPGAIAVAHIFALHAGDSGGHAERGETSVMLGYYPETVDLAALPPPSIPLRNTEFGILDHPTCVGEPTPDFTVRPEQDPRDASAEEGRTVTAQRVRYIVDKVQAALVRVSAAPA